MPLQVSDSKIAIIELSDGALCTIDRADLELVQNRPSTYPYQKSKKILWHSKRDQWGEHYAVAHLRTGNYTFSTIRMHRWILGLTNKRVIVDHIDGNGLNNCCSNLRICSTQANAMNMRVARKGKTSRYKGVCKAEAKGRWLAQINHNYKTIYLGLFDNELDAACAYDKRAKELFGAFARVNGV